MKRTIWFLILASVSFYPLIGQTQVSDVEISVYDEQLKPVVDAEVTLIDETTGTNLPVTYQKTKFGSMAYYAKQVPKSFTLVAVKHHDFKKVKQQFKDGDQYSSPFGGIVRRFNVHLRKKRNSSKKPNAWYGKGANKIYYYSNPKLVGIVLSKAGNADSVALSSLFKQLGLEPVNESPDVILVLRRLKGKFRKYEDPLLEALRASQLIQTVGVVISQVGKPVRIVTNRLLISGNLPDEKLKKENLKPVGAPIFGRRQMYALPPGTGAGVLKTLKRLEKSKRIGSVVPETFGEITKPFEGIPRK